MPSSDAHVLLHAFCDELAACGLLDACTSPGSRSSPIVLALAREPRIRCFSHLDERTAGFFALGMAKASGRPVALACTSGTAAANLAPAVIEAHEARVPLIVLTADRPPELRDVGAGQTIDQLSLYGSAAKWFFDVGTHDAEPARVAWMRMLACRAYWTAQDGRAGPVHLNMALREPLVLDEPLPRLPGGRPGGGPWVRRVAAEAVLPEREARALDALVEAHPRGVVVAGRSERDVDLGRATAAFAAAARYPLLADPLSGARRGEAAVAHYDALLRDDAWASAHRAEVVIRVGDLPTSRALRAWLGALDAEQVVLDRESSWQDPFAAATRILTADPRRVVGALTRERAGAERLAWLDAWIEADAVAAAGMAAALGDGLSEPRVAAELGARLPSDATLLVASSMPVRDVESFFPAREDPPRVLSNRGANGIDGTVSCAYGVAAAGRRGEGRPGPTVLLVGDVALAHDIGGLLCGRRHRLPLVVVLLNNDGGGIFHFLPVAREGELFEEHVATPHGLDFAHASALYGAEHARPADLAELREALDAALTGPGTTIIEVRTDRRENVIVHRRAWEAARHALRG